MAEETPPFPPQHQDKPGLESELVPRPRYQAPAYRPALPHLRPGSVILQTGSITGLEGSQQLLDYSATKGAIHAFTKSLARNLVERGIRVNCVAPGPVWTPLNPSDRPAEDVAHFGADTPYGRPAQSEELAPAYVFFASGADSGFVTGEVLTVLGGDTVAA